MAFHDSPKAAFFSATISSNSLRSRAESFGPASAMRVTRWATTCGTANASSAAWTASDWAARLRRVAMGSFGSGCLIATIVSPKGLDARACGVLGLREDLRSRQGCGAVLDELHVRDPVSPARRVTLSGRAVEDELRLRHDRAQLAFGASDRRLPDHRGATAMQGHALADDPGIHASSGDEFGARVGRGRALARSEVGDRSHGTERVGEGHGGAAVEYSPDRAQVGANLHLADDPIGRQLGDPHAHEPGKQRLEHLLDGGWIWHRCLPEAWVGRRR